MDKRIRDNVLCLMRHFWSRDGRQSYEATRDYCLRVYRDVFPVVSDQVWDMALRDAVVQAVQEQMEK